MADTIGSNESREIWSRAQRGAMSGYVSLNRSWSNKADVAEDASVVADAVLAKYVTVPNGQREIWSRSIEGVINSLIGSRGQRFSPTRVAELAAEIADQCVASYVTRDSHIPQEPAGVITKYLEVTGDDSLDGEDVPGAWATLQSAFDQVPDGFKGDLIFQLGAGTFKPGILRRIIHASSRIIVIGYRGSAPIIDLTGQVFAYSDNARLDSNVGAYGATITNDSHWVETVAMPPDLVSDNVDLVGAIPIASTTPNLNIIAFEPIALAALREYETTIDEATPGDHDFWKLGKSDSDFQVEFIGIDCGVGQMHAKSCSFNSCRKKNSALDTSRFTDCGGYIQLSKASGRWAGIFDESVKGRIWGPVNEVSINVVGTTGSFGMKFLSYVQDNGDANDAMLVRNNSVVSISFYEVNSGQGFNVFEGSVVRSGGSGNFTGPKIATCSLGGIVEFSGGGHTANVSGDGFTISSSGRMDGIEAEFAGATIGGNDVTVGGVISTIAALPADGGVGTNTGAT